MVTDYIRYNFQGKTGYVAHPSHRLVTIGHTASISPWKDPDLHQHNLAEEFYILMNGGLEFLIQDFQITLHANEILMVKSTVPHAIVGGVGEIEHFGIRAPALDDKQIAGKIPQASALQFEDERKLSGEWGCRIPLNAAEHQNCWLIGAGSALYPSQHMILAYLNFLTHETANAGIGTRHQLHLHQKSWEYYTVLEGEKTLQIEETQVVIKAGEILEIPPLVKHTLYSRRAPFRGFTIRVPVALNDKI